MGPFDGISKATIAFCTGRLTVPRLALPLRGESSGFSEVSCTVAVGTPNSFFFGYLSFQHSVCSLFLPLAY